MLPRYADPTDPHNGPTYQTGKTCVTKGCDRPAGTFWSKLLCQPCNAARMAHLDQRMAELPAQYNLPNED